LKKIAVLIAMIGVQLREVAVAFFPKAARSQAFLVEYLVVNGVFSARLSPLNFDHVRQRSCTSHLGKRRPQKKAGVSSELFRKTKHAFRSGSTVVLAG